MHDHLTTSNEIQCADKGIPSNPNRSFKQHYISWDWRVAVLHLQVYSCWWSGGCQHLIQRANEVQFPNMEVWIPQRLKGFYWGLRRHLYCCVLKVPLQIRKSALNSPAAALLRVLHPSALMPSAVATLSPVTSPHTRRHQVRTSNTRPDNWPDPSPSTGVSASPFFLIHFFLLFVHPKIAAPL